MFKDYDVYKLAAQKMIDDNFLILDTETTGLSTDDEIIELGIIDCQGHVLYSGLFKPEKEVHWAASNVSGLTNQMLEGEPLFKDEFDRIMELLNGRPVMAFNEEFDERLFFQTAQRYGLDAQKVEQAFSHAHCAQNLYNHYVDYERTKLEVACAAEDIQMVQDHRATGDCLMTLALLEKVADPSRSPDKQKYLDIKASMSPHKSSENNRGKQSAGEKTAKPSYLELFKQGKGVEEIAEIRGVRVSTAEDGIINLYEKGQIDDISFFIDKKYIADILAAANDPSWDSRLRTIKEQLPEDCTYACIKAVLAQHKREPFQEEEHKPKSVTPDAFLNAPDPMMCKVTFCRTGGVADGHTFEVSLFMTPKDYKPEKEDFSLRASERIKFYQKALEVVSEKELFDYVISNAEMVKGPSRRSFREMLSNAKARAFEQAEKNDHLPENMPGGLSR